MSIQGSVLAQGSRRLVALLVITLACTMAFSQDYSGLPYVVDAARINVRINRDATLDVSEEFDVTFNESRRGIFRKMPYIYDTSRGIARRTKISGIVVNDEVGRKLTQKVTWEGGYVSVRIGDADISFPPGTQKRYVLRYRVENAMNWFGQDAEWEPHAELYWNALGEQWDTYFKRVTVAVEYPEVADPRSAKARIYSGPYGSVAFDAIDGSMATVRGEKTGTLLKAASSSFVFDREVPLPPFTAVTIVVGLPPSAVPEPSALQKFLWLVTANLGFGVPLVILGGLFPLWLRYGRDPRGKTIGVLFAPPEKMTATECGALLDGRVDVRDISAGLITLAVKGHLTIKTEPKGLFRRSSSTITMTGKSDLSGLGPFETSLLNKLTAGGPTLDRADLSAHVGPAMSALREQVFDTLVGKGVLAHSPSSARGLTLMGGLAAVAALVFLARPLLSPGADGTSWIIGGVLGAAIVLIFAGLMPKLTVRGAHLRSDVAGFEQAIRGRKNYLEWVADKHIASARYEEYLPYAMAFGLVREWSDTFKDVVSVAPTWYHGPVGNGLFDLGHFGYDLGTVAESSGYAASTPPRTSSSSGGSGFGFGGGGGGGFSGGGFGGGGGGSW